MMRYMLVKINIIPFDRKEEEEYNAWIEKNVALAKPQGQSEAIEDTFKPGTNKRKLK